MSLLSSILSHVDPTLIVSTIIGAGAWLYDKATGKKTASFASIVSPVFKTFAHELLDRYQSSIDIASYLKTARVYMTNRAWDVLAKRGVPKNAITQKLVDAAIEESSAWLSAELLRLKFRSGPLATVLK